MDQLSSAARLRFGRLLWLMPCAYAVHICEEYFGGFPRYVVDHMGGYPMPPPLFFINNGLFMAILLGLSYAASHRPKRASVWLLLAWASANLFWNFWVHLIFTVTTGVFSPGLVSGSLVYYPLPVLVAFLAWREGYASICGILGAFAAGAALMTFVIWAGVYHFAR